jgi:hypothetical protein
MAHEYSCRRLHSMRTSPEPIHTGTTCTNCFSYYYIIPRNRKRMNDTRKKKHRRRIQRRQNISTFFSFPKTYIRARWSFHNALRTRSWRLYTSFFLPAASGRCHCFSSIFLFFVLPSAGRDVLNVHYFDLAVMAAYLFLLLVGFCSGVGWAKE